MTETNTTARVPQWSRKRFRDEFSNQAVTDLDIPVDQVRMLERVIKNWLDGAPPLSAVEFRMKGRQSGAALEKLEAQQVVTSRDDSVYRLTFYGLTVANALGASGVSRLTFACQKIFAAAKSMFKRAPGNASLPYEDFLATTAIDDKLLRPALQVLGDSGLGIGMSAGGAEARVYASEHVTRYANIWEYFATTIGWRNTSPRSPTRRAGLEDFGAISHFDEILAVVHNGSDLAKKAAGQINTDPAAAITAARSLVEATLKWILHDANADSLTVCPPAKLLKQSLPHVGVEFGHAMRETGIGQMLSGMETALHGVAKMRDELSDAHGRKPGSVSPSRSQARLAVGLALTISGFLVEAREAHKSLRQAPGKDYRPAQ